MGNSTSNIPRNERVKAFFKFIQISGTCTEHQALQFLTKNELREIKASGAFNLGSISCKRKTLETFKEKNVISDDQFKKEMKAQVPTVGTMTANKLGRRFAERAFGFKNIHSGNGRHHDLMIGAKFLSLNEEERASAIPENQVKKELKAAIVTCRRENREYYDERQRHYEEEIKGFIERFERSDNYGSPSDFAYRSSSSGRMVGFEQTTNSYSSYDKAVKSFSCDVLNWDYEEGAI